MAKLKITQLRSVIGALPKQKGTMEALGLHRRHQSVVHEDSPQVRGMINRVSHLVEVEEVES